MCHWRDCAYFYFLLLVTLIIIHLLFSTSVIQDETLGRQALLLMLCRLVSPLPVLTALRAWLTVICPVMCNKTFAWGLVWMWAADTTAVGTTPGLPAIPFPWSFGAGPPAVEGLTMVTPRLVWPAVDIGTLAWEAFVTALPRQKHRNPNLPAKWETGQVNARKMTQSFKTGH